MKLVRITHSAFLSLRVFRSDFYAVLASVEGRRKLRSKELRQGMTTAGGATAGTQEPDSRHGSRPDSRIEIDFVEDGGWSNTGLMLAVAAPVGVVALAALLGFLFFLVYRTGLRGSLA